MTIFNRLITLRFALLALGGISLVSSADAQTTVPAATCPAAEALSPPAGQPTIAPIEVSNNHVFVKVCAGNTPLDFILDTGAGATFFDLDHAKQLGLKIGSAFTVRGAGAGTVAGGRVEGGVVSLIGTDIKQPVPSAIDLSGIPSREGHRMDGILGYDSSTDSSSRSTTSSRSYGSTTPTPFSIGETARRCR